jgi:hypothetical protein
VEHVDSHSNPGGFDGLQLEGAFPKRIQQLHDNSTLVSKGEGLGPTQMMFPPVAVSERD